MSRLQVMHIIHSLTLGDGITQVVRTIAQQINREKFGLSICCLAARGDMAEQFEKEGFTVHCIKATSSPSPAHWISNAYAVFRLARLLKRERIDILHTHEFFSGTLGRVAGRLAGVPVIILSLHRMDTWKGNLHIFIDRCLAKLTDKIVTNSQAVKQSAIEYGGIAAEKFEVIYNGIDLSQFDGAGDKDKLRREFGLKPQNLIIGTVGRLAREKGFQYLIRAAAIVRSKRPNVKFMIGSRDAHPSESVKDELYGLVKGLNLKDTVIFAGLRKDITSVFAAFDIFVLPSVMLEGFGLVLVEAMAMRKPVIASRVGGIPEIVLDGVTGTLVPARDTMALASEILRLLDDPTLRYSMGACGRQRVEDRFTAEIMGKKVEALYASLAREKILSYFR